MHIVDWIILGSYLAYITISGAVLGKNEKSLSGFLLAGRSLPWWAAGLSIMATQMSAITLIGTTGKAYEDGLRFIQFYYGMPLAMLILCFTAVPFFHRAKVYTAYEFLERRFDARTRTLAASVFLLSRGLSCGVIIAAPSVVLSLILGWSEIATIAAIGLTTTAYTLLGGVRAVAWTDTKQMIFILLGLGAVAFSLFAAFGEHFTLGGLYALARATDHLTIADTSFDPNEKYTVWSGFIAGTFLMLSYFGCDQSQVQRYLSASDERASKRSLLMNAALKIPLQMVILTLGVGVFLYYQFHSHDILFQPTARTLIENSTHAPEFKKLRTEFEENWEEKKGIAEQVAGGAESDQNELLRQFKGRQDRENQLRDQASVLAAKASNNETFSDVNYVFPHYILEVLPVGILGLFIATIFAAAMSSVSSELSALASTTVIDIYKRHWVTSASEEHYVMIARLSTGVWGVFASISAYYASNLGALIEVVNRFGSYFYGSLLGVFLLAFTSKHTSSSGAFYGLLLSVLIVGFIDASNLGIAFLWYNVIGAVSVMTIGLLLSPKNRKPR